jgi:hypothetical protein
VVTPGLFADTVTFFSFENVRTGLTPFTKTVDGLRAARVNVFETPRSIIY